MTVALCADLGTCGALDTPAAFAECVRMLTSTSVELKKSAEGEFGEQLQLEIAGDGEVRCSHTHDLYVLKDSELTKLPSKSSTGSK
jgi:hypothetical protein